MKRSKLFLTLICILSTLPLVFCACGECEHSWDKGFVAKAPTTTQKGFTIYTCTDCGEMKSEEIPMLTHVEHTYTKQIWGGDETHHWFKCDFDDCQVTTNKTEHTFVDKFGGGMICQVCRMDKKGS